MRLNTKQEHSYANEYLHYLAGRRGSRVNRHPAKGGPSVERAAAIRDEVEILANQAAARFLWQKGDVTCKPDLDRFIWHPGDVVVTPPA